jgi:hypothetical protein
MSTYKNHIILLVVSILTVIACIYALKWHAVYKEELLNSTIITDYINELKGEELKSYVTDNPLTIVYFGVKGNEDCRKFENELKKYIVNHNLHDVMVYVNLNNLSTENFGTQFDSLYNTKVLRDENKYLNKVPVIAVYNHLTLIDFVSNDNLTIKRVDSLLSDYSFDGE